MDRTPEQQPREPILRQMRRRSSSFDSSDDVFSLDAALAGTTISYPAQRRGGQSQQQQPCRRATVDGTDMNHQGFEYKTIMNMASNYNPSRRRPQYQYDPRRNFQPQQQTLPSNIMVNNTGRGGGVQMQERTATQQHSQYVNNNGSHHQYHESSTHRQPRSQRNNTMRSFGSSRTKSPTLFESPIYHGSSGGGGQHTNYNRHSSTPSTNNPSWFNEHDPNTNYNGRNSNNDIYNDNEDNWGGDDDDDDDDDDDRTTATMATRHEALRPSAINKAKDMTYPTGDVTIIYTDVQGSTSLWESCPSDMKKAQDIHDDIMRRCYTNHSGYEITTEGDAFNLAFQHPADALAFALQAQIKLYKADWPEGILKHPDGKHDPAFKFRGFRVRFGIHHGPTSSRVHEMTGRTIYSGEGVNISKAVERMCHGGQILTTMETWKAVSGMAERYLGRPQVLDCGEHLLFETKVQNPGPGGGVKTTRCKRRIMQLVPSDLAFDFFEARGRREVPGQDGKTVLEVKDSANIQGRLFPPVISKRQLTTSFLNAPYANGRVTICFVYTVGLKGDNPSMKAKNLAILAKCIRKQLLGMSPPGYECQEDAGCWMLAFDRLVNAVFFGLQLKSALMGVDGLVGDVDRDNMFKVGIISGPFTSMGPHRTTGMADYFGPIVNRSARVASNCKPGQVCVGIPLSEGVTADPPDFGDTVNVSLQEIKKLKGITIDMAIFSCSMI